MKDAEKLEYLHLKWMEKIEMEKAIREVLEEIEECKVRGNVININWVEKRLKEATQ